MAEQRHWFYDGMPATEICLERGISYALALSIGHPHSCIALSGDNVQVAWMDPKKFQGGTWAMREQQLWRTFDYRDPAIAWAIAAHYNIMPFWRPQGNRWHARSYWTNNRTSASTAAGPGTELRMFGGDTPQESVARAVITIAEELGGVWRI